MTDEERYTEAERIRGLFPDGLLAFLLAEAERLRAENATQDVALFDWDMRLRALESENAAMREIVQEMIDAFTAEVAVDDPTIAKARALLAAHEASETEGGTAG